MCVRVRGGLRCAYLTPRPDLMWVLQNVGSKLLASYGPLHDNEGPLALEALVEHLQRIHGRG